MPPKHQSFLFPQHTHIHTHSHALCYITALLHTKTFHSTLVFNFLLWEPWSVKDIMNYSVLLWFCGSEKGIDVFPGSWVMTLCWQSLFVTVLNVQVAHLTLNLALMTLCLSACDAHREVIFCALTSKCDILHPVVCKWWLYSCRQMSLSTFHFWSAQLAAPHIFYTQCVLLSL